MSVFAMSTTEAIDLDLSGLTSVLAVILGIGVIVLLVWMWRIGHQLESAVEPSAEPREASPDVIAAMRDGVGR